MREKVNLSPDVGSTLNPFPTNVPFMQKSVSWFLLAKMFQKYLRNSDILSKDAGR